MGFWRLAGSDDQHGHELGRFAAREVRQVHGEVPQAHEGGRGGVPRGRHA